MVRTAAEKAAADKVLRSWHTGRVALSVYGAAAMAFLWILASVDRHSRDLYEVIGAVLAGGVAVALVVALRNEWRGQDLAEWEPELDGPATLAEDRRLHSAGATAYVLGLIAVSGFALLVQNLAANNRAVVEGKAHVTGCSTNHRSRVTTCHGRWTVAGHTYSGALPGGGYTYSGTRTIHYDPDDPASLGGRSIGIPLVVFLVAGVGSGTLTWRWLARARDPYIDEVERIAVRRVEA